MVPALCCPQTALSCPFWCVPYPHPCVLVPLSMCPLCPHIPHPHVPRMSPFPATFSQCSSISHSPLSPMFLYVPCPPVSPYPFISPTVPHPSVSVSVSPSVPHVPIYVPIYPHVSLVSPMSMSPTIPHFSHVSSCLRTPCPTDTGQIPVPSLHVPTGPRGAVGDLWDGHHILCIGIGGHHSSGATSSSGTSAGHGPKRSRCVPMGRWHLDAFVTVGGSWTPLSPSSDSLSFKSFNFILPQTLSYTSNSFLFKLLSFMFVLQILPWFRSPD